MTPEDKGRLSRNEQKLRETMEITTIAGLPDFPFQSLSEVKTANQSGTISIGTIYHHDLLEALGSRGDIVMSYVWLSMPFVAGLLFIVAAIAKGNYWYLVGLLSTTFGFLLSSPGAKGCANPLIGLSWIPLVYFIFKNPLWAWVVAGFDAGYIFASTVREQFRGVMKERALESEVFFCYLYLNKVILIKDTKTGRFI